MNIGILEWTDENSKGEYPLSKSIGLKDVIVDARFLQFDGSIPVLNTISVAVNSVKFNITFDQLTKDVVVDDQSFLDTRTIIVYRDGTNRYLGSLTLGQGFLRLFSASVGSVFKLNTPFAATTVVAINPNSGVFSYQGLTGAVAINTTNTDGDKNIFFGIDTDLVIWNAVGIPKLPVTTYHPLKTLNGVHPINNQIRIDDSEVLKVQAGLGGLNLELANSPLNDKIGPTVSYA